MIIQRRSIDCDCVGYCFRLCEIHEDGEVLGYINDYRVATWDNMERFIQCNHKLIMEEL